MITDNMSVEETAEPAGSASATRAARPQSVSIDPRPRSFRLNTMVVGESGLGKSTFLCTFYDNLVNGWGDGEGEDRIWDGAGNGTPTVKIVELGRHRIRQTTQAGTEIELTVIDTPGYGDHINNEESFKPITDYIIDKNRKWYSLVRRGQNAASLDERVHLCFYFIAPHRLKHIDVEFLKRLQDRVPIVPIIAKADTMTISEKAAHQEKVLQAIQEHSIRVFPLTDPAEVMAVIADKIGHRAYPWGTAERDNAAHSDFSRLRQLIFEQHLYGLVECTDEKFRFWLQEVQQEARERAEKAGQRRSIWEALSALRPDGFGLAVLLLLVAVAGIAVHRGAVGDVVGAFAYGWRQLQLMKERQSVSNRALELSALAAAYLVKVYLEQLR